MSSRTKKSAKKKASDPIFNGKTKMVLWIAGAVVTVTGAVVGINNALPVLEPYAPATHSFTRELTDGLDKRLTQAQNNTAYILRDIQIEQAQGKIDATSDAVVKWKLERSKTQDPVTQSMIDSHVNDLGAQAQRLHEQLKVLQQIKAKEH